MYYFDQTFHSTAAPVSTDWSLQWTLMLTRQGATVSLSFNGWGVTVYGSKWDNHG